MIPKISQLGKKISIIVFSAYIDKKKLKKIAQNHQKSSNITIIGCFNKKEPVRKYLEVLIPILENTEKQSVFVNNDSSQIEELLNSSKAKQNLLDLNDVDEIVDNSSVDIDEKKEQFDYEQLDLETQLIVKQKADEIRRLLRRSAQDICDIGRFLTEVKQRLKHGQFYPWLKSELQWSSTSAVRFMKVYEKFKSFNLNDLDIAPSALYELSNSAVPSEAITETIESASIGESITLETAKSIRKEYQQKRESKSSNNSEKNELDAEKLSSSNRVGANATFNSETEKEHDLAEPSLTTTSVKQEIIKIISPQRLWRVGKQEQHIISCQDPNSIKFMEQLPSEISLCLTFAPDKHWKWECERYDSSMNLYSKHKDLDPVSLIKSVRHTIETTTAEGDNIVVCFVPHIKPHVRILSLIDTLGCRAIIAEPNRQKCLELVEASKNFS